MGCAGSKGSDAADPVDVDVKVVQGGKKGQKATARPSEAARAAEEKQRALELESATRVQAHVRGNADREKVENMKHA